MRDPEIRTLADHRLIGKMPTIAAYAFRHRMGLPYIYPEPDLSYTENFMNMLWKTAEPKYLANPVLARALDMLFILHADHEQNCSHQRHARGWQLRGRPVSRDRGGRRRPVRPIARRRQRRRAAHAGRIGSKDQIPEYIKGEGRQTKLMGFGHRVYKNYDPRARIIKRVAEEVFEVTGRNPKIDIALELERIALDDEYFVKRKLYPNVDFYSGIIYEAMGFTPTCSPCCSDPADRRLAGAVAGDDCGPERRLPVRARSSPAKSARIRADDGARPARSRVCLSFERP